MAKPEGYIVVTVKLTKEAGQWAAECLELGTAACADNLPEAVEAIGELIELHVNTLEAVGERRAFFKEHGITFHRLKPRAEKARQVTVAPNEFVTRLIEPVLALASG